MEEMKDWGVEQFCAPEGYTTPHPQYKGDTNAAKFQRTTACKQGFQLSQFNGF
jgi:hypothetical protein